jgi:DNA end-binding protein Ku
MEKLITAKAEGATLPAAAETEEKGEVIDLMTALERSVEAAKSSRKRPEKPARKSARKPAPKKAEKKASSA